jgi:adenylate cyclase
MDHEITPEDVLLLEAIGRQAGVAIQNARLYQETRRHLEALEKAHQELMVLDRMKSDFVSTVSHELRSPLAVIEGFAKTLTEHFDRIDRETQMESIEIILKKSIALEGLIENILDMSRIEEGRLDVSREPFDIVELCRVVSEDQERVAELHNLIINPEKEELIVVADREKTEIAMGNLIRNALKFSPEGGAVTVSVKQTDGSAEVSVTDEGIGIAPEQVERVFDRFYQIDSSETRSFPGSGLGLYIAKELVQSMGGEIMVESEQGRGSTFTFTLPLA